MDKNKSEHPKVLEGFFGIDGGEPRVTQIDVMTAKELAAQQFAPTKWIIPGVLPEGVCLFVGSPKIGKSWFALDVCLAVSLGTTVLREDIKIEQGESLYLALEDNKKRSQKRLLAKLGQVDPPEGCYLCWEWPRIDEGGVAELKSWLSEHPGCRLVVIDTLAKFRAPSKGKTPYYEQDYKTTSTLTQIAAEYEVAIILVHHTNKGVSTEDVLHSISGTQGLSGGADTVLVMKRKRYSDTGELHVTGRDIEEEQEYGLAWNRERYRWEITGSGREAVLDEALRRILEIVKTNPGITGGQIARVIHPEAALGSSSKEQRQVYRQINGLEDRGMLERWKKGYLYIPN